jgi:hydrogenase nickel incorporation protein HypA/HybF
MAGQPAVKIRSVRLKVGALSGVVEGALQFGYEIATEGTMLAGSQLTVENLPVVIYCKPCDALRELNGVQSFRCPVCNTPSGDIRQGRELEIESVEVEEAA